MYDVKDEVKNNDIMLFDNYKANIRLYEHRPFKILFVNTIDIIVFNTQPHL